LGVSKKPIESIPGQASQYPSRRAGVANRGSTSVQVAALQPASVATVSQHIACHGGKFPATTSVRLGNSSKQVQAQNTQLPPSVA
jgi:hypothetical protein